MKPRSKYRNVKCELDGKKFDSKRERDFYSELKLRERAGEVSDIVCHPSYPLWINRKRVGTYVADFLFVDHAAGKRRVVDIKSPATAKNVAFRRWKRVAEALYDIEVEVIF